MRGNIEKLLGDIASKCICNKISFNLEYKKLVDESNLPCSGYFDETSLVVAVDKKNETDWIGTLIHESCHLDQFLQKSKLWINDNIGLDIVEEYVKNRKKDKKKVLNAIKNTMLLEIDCEKRSIKKFKKYKINIDLKKYIREANAYIFSYVYAYENKKWYPVPYENLKITKNMPCIFLKLDDYFKEYEKYKSLYHDRTHKRNKN
jgi:hypothetical protein